MTKLWIPGVLVLVTSSGGAAFGQSGLKCGPPPADGMTVSLPPPIVENQILVVPALEGSGGARSHAITNAQARVAEFAANRWRLVDVALEPYSAGVGASEIRVVISLTRENTDRRDAVLDSLFRCTARAVAAARVDVLSAIREALTSPVSDQEFEEIRARLHNALRAALLNDPEFLDALRLNLRPTR